MVVADGMWHSRRFCMETRVASECRALLFSLCPRRTRWSRWRYPFFPNGSPSTHRPVNKVHLIKS